MRIKSIYLFLASVMGSAFIAVGCMEKEDVILSSSEYITFRPTIQNGAQISTRGLSSHFEVCEEDWLLELAPEETKADLQYTLGSYTDGAGVFGYYTSGETTGIWDLLNNATYKFDGDEMYSDAPPRWSKVPDNTSSMKVYAYAPRIDGNSSNKIMIDDVFSSSSQRDYIAAASETIAVGGSSTYTSIDLPFEHIYAAVRLKAGFDCTITSVTITNIRTSGTYTIGQGWDDPDSNSGSYSLGNVSLQVKDGDVIGVPVLMIPQTLAGSVLSIETNEGNYSVSLNNKEWRQGKLITYTLKKKSADDTYIYFDLAAGNVVIKDNDYSGKVFVEGSEEAREISGTHKNGNKYYVYQSCTKCTTSVNYKVPYTGSGFIPPVYDEVMWEGKRWRDFITNNTNVESVIEAWDNAPGAGQDDNGKPTPLAKHTNREGAAGAVRNVGREATKYHINISGNVGEVILVIDNIYSSYHHLSSDDYKKADPINRERTKGGISFRPSQNEEHDSDLTIRILGDNRVGCVHYENYVNSGKISKNEIINNNSLTFEGSGSLTVADADFSKRTFTANGKPVTGYYSNRACSVIGGKDQEDGNEGYDHAYNIIFNSGVIYAGATAAEYCTAIGGGGNGHSNITINGGTITAVASGTGTAIGGGTGFSYAGGRGYVTINNGNVYAYNFTNIYNIPSSAIGGAGSSAKEGSLGKVIINGGNVYAESGLGTAIGGGSSSNQRGGSAQIEIYGGNVIAKSLSASSAGIGGGTTGFGGNDNWTGGDDSKKNGGDAIVIIGKEAKINDLSAPILRTGSIGGGGSGVGGNIGNAKITIYGGDIQAQFVMADSPSNSFIMEGGLIRNSDTSDEEYKCIQKNGGAVYMKKGTFTMNGGTIKNCSAMFDRNSKGGAVYIEGDENTEFTMEGGTIQGCEAWGDGGAVYLKRGKVSLIDGIIKENVSHNGNGGAICVLGGDFTMDGGQVTSNGAYSRYSDSKTGGGGGIYVAPESNSSSQNISVMLNGGTVENNSSDRNGGGVCVDMGQNESANLHVEVSNSIVKNSTLLKGGGLYVYGSNANVNIEDGSSVLQNSTSAYQLNQQIAVAGGGLVILADDAEGVTDQVTVTFNDNASYYGKTVEGLIVPDNTKPQYIVRSNDNKLKPNTFTKTGYRFKHWNTRRDGKGVSYSDQATVNFDSDIPLFAIWIKE